METNNHFQKDLMDHITVHKEAEINQYSNHNNVKIL